MLSSLYAHTYLATILILWLFRISTISHIVKSRVRMRIGSSAHAHMVECACAYSRVRMRIQCVKGDSSGINRTMDKVLSGFQREKKEKVSESGYTG